MAKLHYGATPTSVVLRVKLMNSSVSTGAGLTGLSSASSGLIISTIKIGDASPVTYTAAGSTIETISTLGTYAAPTATKCRFKEVDATNHPGVYEIQLADARFASTDSLLVSVSGATNLAQTDLEVQCTNLAANMTQALGTAITCATAGIPDVNAKNHGGTAQTGRDIGASVLLSSGSGTGQLDFTSGVVKSNMSQILGTALTETAGYLAAGFKKFFNIAAPVATVASVDQTGDSYAIVKSGGAGDAAAIKTQTDKMQFDVSNNIKSVKNATTAGTADFNATEKASIVTAGSTSTPVVTVATNGITATSIATDAINAASVKADAVTKIQNGLATPTNITAGTITTVSGNVNGGVGSLASQAQTDVKTAMTSQGYTTTRAGYLDTLNGIVAAIWAAATRTLTSLSGLTVDTVTNLTNAPANGDLTATMKSSIGTQVWTTSTPRTITSLSGLTADANLTKVDGVVLAAHTAGYVPADIEAASDVNVVQINGSADAAEKLGLSANSEQTGTVLNAEFEPTITQFDTDLTESLTDHYKDRWVLFTDGDLAGVGKPIVGYQLTIGGGRLSTTAFPQPPAAGDAFIVV